MKNRSLTTITIFKAASLLLFLLLSFQSFAQQPKVNAEIDSTSIKIGEQLIYSIEVETDSTNLVVFPEARRQVC